MDYKTVIKTIPWNMNSEIISVEQELAHLAYYAPI